MPNNPTTSLVSGLNELLHLHRGSLICHIAEARPDLNAQSWRAWQSLSKLQEHRIARVGLLTSILAEDLNSQPQPGIFEQNVGFFHFMNLNTLLPKLLSELQAMHQSISQLNPTGNPRIDSKLIEAMNLCEADIMAVKLAGEQLISDTSAR